MSRRAINPGDHRPTAVNQEHHDHAIDQHEHGHRYVSQTDSEGSIPFTRRPDQ